MASRSHAMLLPISTEQSLFPSFTERFKVVLLSNLQITHLQAFQIWQGSMANVSSPRYIHTHTMCYSDGAWERCLNPAWVQTPETRYVILTCYVDKTRRIQRWQLGVLFTTPVINHGWPWGSKNLQIKKKPGQSVFWWPRSISSPLNKRTEPVQ